MISENAVRSGGAEECCRCFLETTDKDGTLGANNLGANVVAVNCLDIGFNVAEGAMGIFQGHNAGNHVSVLRDLRANCDRGISMNFGDFIAHCPARQVEVVNRIVVEQHAVDVRLVGSERRDVFIATNGFEYDGLADLPGFDALYGSGVRGIVASHETDLKANSVFYHRVDGTLSIGAIGGDWFFAKDVFARVSSSLDRVGMEFVGSGDENGVNVLRVEHLLETAQGCFDLEFLRSLAGPLRSNVSDSNEPRFGD